MRNFALLLLRVVAGGLMVGHGAQKLFGAFGGHGFKGTAKMMQGMGLKPAEQWALLGGASEFGGGLLTMTGFLNPLGPIAVTGAMGMATAKVHWGKPIWVTSGGAEYPLTNMAIAVSLSMLGPGNYSLDNALHIRLPRRLILVPGLLAAATTVAMAVMVSRQNQSQQSQQRDMEQTAQQAHQEQHGAVPVPETPAAASAPTEPQQPEMPPVPEMAQGQQEQAPGELM